MKKIFLETEWQTILFTLYVIESAERCFVYCCRLMHKVSTVIPKILHKLHTNEKASTGHLSIITILRKTKGLMMYPLNWNVFTSYGSEFRSY